MSGARRCRGGCLLWACAGEFGHAGACGPVPPTARPVEVLADPTASDWLREALRSALPRDAVDALNDATALLDILTAHCERCPECGGAWSRARSDGTRYCLGCLRIVAGGDR